MGITASAFDWDGCEGMMPAQKIELRPILSFFIELLAPRWRSKAAAVGVSGGGVFSAGEPARVAGGRGAGAAVLLCGVDCGAVVRRRVGCAVCQQRQAHPP